MANPASVGLCGKMIDFYLSSYYWIKSAT